MEVEYGRVGSQPVLQCGAVQPHSEDMDQCQSLRGMTDQEPDPEFFMGPGAQVEAADHRCGRGALRGAGPTSVPQ